MKFDIWGFLKKSLQTIQVSLIPRRNKVNTYVHLWQYLIEFFLEWEQFRTKFADNYKAHILCSVQFFQKSCRLWDNGKKFGTAKDATHANTWRLHFACWITTATTTHSEYVILIVFHGHNGYANAPQCYVVCTLHALPFHLSLSIRPIFSGILTHWLASLKIINT
jgi:hypothetical protein